MRKLLLYTSLLCLPFAMYAQQDCANAIAVAAGTHTVDGIDGEAPTPVCTTETTDPASNGEWYIYTAPAGDDVYVTVTSDLEVNSGGDTRVQIYTGDCDNLNCLIGDDDAGNVGNGFLSVASFQATAGESYYIAWDNRWSSAGFDFEINEADEPPPGQITFTAQGTSTSGSRLAMVDMNGDYLDDLVSVSATNININYQLEAGGFDSVNINTTPADYTPSWSLAVGDIDSNGYNDLLYGGGSGVTFMMANEDGTAYTEISGPEYVFSQRSNFVDLNNDGHLDAFVCHDVAPNVYYINDGEGNLTFYQGADPDGIPSGLGLVANGGNYGTVWIDYDNDRDMDLFIAKCRGGNTPAKINQLHRNNGDNTFTNVAGDAGVNLADPVQTWSSAWGDYDNDGDMDGYIGASSTSDGPTKYMRNNGDGTFTDISGSVDLSNTPLGIENAPADFDNDGHIDIFSNGQILLNGGDGLSFETITQTVPQSGAIGDANNDGFLDIFSNGLFLNNGNDNNWIKIVTVGDESNLNGIGARVEITSPGLGTQIRDVRSGEGFRYMSSLNTHFGLGQDEEIETVTVYWPSGLISLVEDPDINDTLIIYESEALSIDEITTGNDLKVYPNPADNVINLETSIQLNNAIYSVFTVDGKRVMNAKLGDTKTIDVSGLATGNYFIRILQDNTTYVQQFLKK
ncbi:FG-GAP-like repeat-containing protein [Dokdonia pacifica]|uniref:Por secretion system C-terminal sorting domain-containing protein n=1 Tax=Dokdonia pacifica TaxID=1627892 RepID=A0A239BI16_9FLAO|nr:FG-GAP-like repeat-containing protein [Dokdonia pacifica]SNS06683.1 Por secretion system C-terminal sorting domain-containing protein [Dokdonia pacifica]